LSINQSFRLFAPAAQVLMRGLEGGNPSGFPGLDRKMPQCRNSVETLAGRAFAACFSRWISATAKRCIGAESADQIRCRAQLPRIEKGDSHALAA
jgi:hypothetical protein